MSALHWAFAKLVIRKVRINYLNSTDYSSDLYKKARSGELRGFTGIDSKYEEPENPDLILNAGQETENECVQRLLRFLYEKKIIPDPVSLK
jgi:adenylylsulfate kinase-like enzyme